MKAKKAIKRLDRAEAILSDVIDQYASNGSQTRNYLGAARVSIGRAKADVSKNLKAANGKQAKADKSGVKRKGVQPETAPKSAGQTKAKKTA